MPHRLLRRLFPAALWLSLAAAIFPAATGGAQRPSEGPPRNLLADGGLEKVGTDGLPVGWRKYVYGAQPAIAIDTAVLHEGKQSLCVGAQEPSDTALGLELQLKPGAAYCFTGWVRTRELKPEPRSWTYGTYQIQDIPGRVLARLRNHKGTTDWCQEQVCFRAPADGKVRISCFFIGYGKGTGTAWFDDLSLVEAAAPTRIVVTAKRLSRDPISPLIYGNFMELLSDLVPSMWAEKLDVTSFEFLRTPGEQKLRQSRFTFDPKLDPQDRPWQPVGERAHAEWAIDEDRPFSGKASQRIRLAEGGSEAGIAQDGIFVERDKSYRFVGHFRQQGLAGPVYAELRRKGMLLARRPIEPVGTDWSRRQVELRPTATATDATFVLAITTPGTVWIDRVSLVPADTVDGWRPDAIAAVRAMKPGVIRWGGSTTEGYSWKDGVGPWERRVPWANRYWGRVDPNLVGIDEFVAFCRAVDAEPLLCVRFSGQRPADAAEQVDYCNGPASSPMGVLRARNGHPQPYGVKLWQIGNEVGGAAYDATVADFARAMRKADPSVQILASYISERLLANAAGLIDYVSPHHYDCANLQGTEAEIDAYADLIERFAPGRIKLSVTEWNTTAGDWGRDRRHLWTLQNGLACARYLNLCHRRADLVKIACRSNISNSYCSGIIQTNSHAVYGTPAYHVSKLYAEHAGAYPLALGSECALLDLDVSANLSGDGKRLSLAVVNPQREPVTRTIDLSAFAKLSDTAKVWTIADADDTRDPEATNSFARPERIAARSVIVRIPGPSFKHQFPAYSVSVIEVGVDSK